MNFEVRFSATARADLGRQFDVLLERATTHEDLERALNAVEEIQAAARGHLSRTPFIFRKAGSNPLQRELVIPFGGTGYVLRYEIEPSLGHVVVVGVRHQREDDLLR